uniref:TF_AP-2 domain-containing protein n=1 Tax=Syphacia muris TaxID=451379 RepID=A0A0N5AAN8_9BILA
MNRNLLTTPFIGDSQTTCFGMPYVFPVQTTVPKCEIYSSSDSGASNGEIEEKGTFVDTSKKDTVVKAVTTGNVISVPKELYPQAVFCKVPSRTAVQKPKMLTVTVGEVYRRVFGPEMMNVSLLGSYLRRAKEKDGGKTLRDELTKLGMFVPLGRRKNGSTTTWTCFVEEEAQAMAVDLDVASRKFFPVQDFSQTIKERINCADNDLRVYALSMRKLLKVMRQIFVDDRSPVHGREDVGSPIQELEETLLKKGLQDGLYRFSCCFSCIIAIVDATHGFGSLALTSAIDLFDAFMEALLEDCDFSNEVSTVHILRLLKSNDEWSRLEVGGLKSVGEGKIHDCYVKCWDGISIGCYHFLLGLP